MRCVPATHCWASRWIMRVDVAALQQANPEIDPLALQVGQQIVVPPPGPSAPVATPIILELPMPTCYDMITGRTLCLGQVMNTQAETVEQVRVRLQLLDGEGRVLAETATGVEHILIPPGAAAPYSAIFDASRSAQVAVSTLLVQSADQSDWIVLEAEATDVERREDYLHIEARIHNPSEHTIGQARVVLTLFSNEGQVVGLRVVTLADGFGPGETRTVVLEAVALSVDTPLTYQLFAEGRWL